MHEKIDSDMPQNTTVLLLIKGVSVQYNTDRYIQLLMGCSPEISCRNLFISGRDLRSMLPHDACFTAIAVLLVYILYVIHKFRSIGLPLSAAFESIIHVTIGSKLTSALEHSFSRHAKLHLPLANSVSQVFFPVTVITSMGNIGSPAFC